MTEFYDSNRGCTVCYVSKAAKDNKVAKKGEPYIWVKRTKFSDKEYFKTEEEFFKAYPNEFTFSFKFLESLLREFKKELNNNENIKIKDFLNSKGLKP